MSIEQQLDDLLELNARLLDAAESGRWEDVNELANTRNELSRIFFRSVNNQNVTGLSDKLLEIGEYDARLVSLVKDARDSTLDELRTLSRYKHGYNAYQQNQSD